MTISLPTKSISCDLGRWRCRPLGCVLASTSLRVDVTNLVTKQSFAQTTRLCSCRRLTTLWG